MIREIAPDLCMHASTQMTSHSLAGAVAAKELDFSRVVLSRELPLEEIRYISQNAPVETEIFVHGALCMCYSGQCYMSAVIGQRSGNRGLCAQPCRLPYHFMTGKPGYYLSLKDMSLAKLLKELVKIDGDYVIRLLYLYPDEITDELIDVVKNNDKILNYFDIPVQHASDKVLKWMGRRGNEELINNLLDKIRKEIPDVVLRTTVMVGFPHESEKDFEILKQFIERNKFDHLGAFTYSREENTKAYKMNMQVPQKVKEKRLDEVMEVQKWISYNQNKKYLNKVYDCIVESFDSENNQYYGRGYMHAPDDIDGEIIIKTFKDLIISKKYKVKIIDTDFFDIYGEIID